MKKLSHSILALMFTGLLMVASSFAQAADHESYDSMAAPSFAQADVHESYGSHVGHKALNGFSNMTTAVLEIPKNIINTYNQSNIAYGTVGGMAKGILNTVGRMMSGLTDFVTAPLPTKQFVYPAYIWDDFDEDTTYGEVFRLHEDTMLTDNSSP